MEDTLVNADIKSAVLVSSKPGCFIAGADIAWLDSAKDKDEVFHVALSNVLIIEASYSSLAPPDLYKWSGHDAKTGI